jgi:hypothetical protein
MDPEGLELRKGYIDRQAAAPVPAKKKAGP